MSSDLNEGRGGGGGKNGIKWFSSMWKLCRDICKQEWMTGLSSEVTSQEVWKIWILG
jgi:hypothetical protein